MVKFSKSLSIGSAYTRMTSEIESVLETQKFSKLRRACVQTINSLGSNLPQHLAPKILCTTTLDDMLDVFAQSPYWNWFDTRLLQALVSVSGSPEAEEWLENFKATFYAKKVTEVIPYVTIKPFKESIDIVEKFDKDPKDLTISELLEHKYKLEYELDVDEGELVLSCIKTGCVELTWQIPRELVYRAYTSMKRKHDELSSLAVKSLVCEEADELVGLPILWRGQEVGEVGPIEPLPEHVRQEPYSLPQGFQWVPLSSSNVEEVVKFMNKCTTEIFGTTCGYKSKDLINHCLTYPNTRNEWQFGIQSTGGKLVGIVLSIPKHICIKKEIKVFLEVTKIKCQKKYKNKRLMYILTKELMRRASFSKIYQLILHSIPLFKPVSTVVLWVCKLNHSQLQLPSSPRTPGWRRMTSEDVPSALALINKWSSQFEIRQVFNSEEEFSYNFLLHKFMVTYVVEDKSNNITDLVCYTLSDMPQFHSTITTLVSTQIPVEQLIIDALVCARENNQTEVSIRQNNIESDILASLSFQPSGYYNFHFYNYRYYEIPQTKFWAFD